MARVNQTSDDSGRVILGLDAAERAERRRQLLLDTALEMFATSGFAGTTIEGLCQKALVGNKAFYEHFRNKAECYVALLQRCTERTFNQVVAAIPDDDADEEVTTRALVGALAHALTDDPRVSIVTFGVAGGITVRIDKLRRENRRGASGLVVSTWERSGDDLPENVGAIALAVIGGLFGLIGDELDRVDYRPDPSAVDELITTMADFVLAVRRGMN
ncbi:MAG: TetR/AcrR family transcriptional regulator [Gordonia sp. (in: high G+C Gram-positive bacteria)]|nr:TetR/AcrR family transcriptional regulator [Gordonia sp. (in: high G+C Gram-positive bacteria)]